MKYTKNILILLLGAAFLVAAGYTYVHFKKSLRMNAYYKKEILDLLRSQDLAIEDISKKSLDTIEHLRSLDALNSTLLTKGKIEMSEHKIVICGISRDNAGDLPRMIRDIERLGGMFKDYRVIIFENDSKDGTKDILTNWRKQNNKVNIISEDYNVNKRPSIQFLADIRNKYIEALRSDLQYKEFDMIAISDMDMKYGWDVRGIEDSFSKIDKWDGVCSNGIYNQKGNLYDAFAFRNAEFPIGPNESSDYWTKIVSSVQKIYPVGSDLVPVYSCFGGLAFYKKNMIEGCAYEVINGDCEHLMFHQCLREKHKGRMVMNPNQILRYSHYTLD